MAPVIIFIIGSGPLAAESCMLAAENCMVSATSLGLGSCWAEFGALLDCDADCRRMLKLGEQEHIIAPILIGYEEGAAPSVPRKKTDISWV